MRLPGFKNVLYFGLKCSKSSRFLGLRPRPRCGSLRHSPIPPSRERLLAFGNRSFAPSAPNSPLPPQQKKPPPYPLVVRGFLPSAIVVSRLRRLIPISPPNKNTRPISPQTKNPRTATAYLSDSFCFFIYCLSLS